MLYFFLCVAIFGNIFQYGALERCKELIEGGYDINKRDNENVTLLHWASINNRRDIVRYDDVKQFILRLNECREQYVNMHENKKNDHVMLISDTTYLKEQ